MEQSVARVCNVCKRSLPVHRFGRRRADRPALRAECYDCQRDRKHRWIASMSPDRLAEYNRMMDKAFDKGRKKATKKRAKAAEARYETSAGIVKTLRERGMNLSEISRRSGVARNTIIRIAKDTPVAYRRAHVEQKLIDLLIADNRQRAKEKES